MTQKFVYQKWPDQIFPVVNCVFSRDGPFGLGGGGGDGWMTEACGGGGGAVPWHTGAAALLASGPCQPRLDAGAAQHRQVGAGAPTPLTAQSWT